LLRLPLGWRMAAAPPSVAGGPVLEISETENRVEFDWAHEAARQTGIIAHRFLRRIAQDGLDRWSVDRIVSLRPGIERDASGLGFSTVECRALSERVTLALQTALLDPRGRWLLDSRHSLAQSEYALTGLRGGVVSRYALDRTFVDADGVRWIVDFKLSTHAGGDLETFLAREQERYCDQLDAYAQVMRGLDSRPIKLGLYFPLLAGWREWPYAH
jgi:ATP-dependent helicase/nuclease subunit A